VRGPVTNEGRLRRAAFFLLLGLGVESLSLAWSHPLSFYLFVAGGGLFAFLGIWSFLLSFVSPPARRGSWGSVTPLEKHPEESAQAVNS
jgi:hypothetical protein